MNSITFNPEKKRYEVRFHYHPDLVTAVKNIPGRVFNPENLTLDKFWTVPPTPAGISALESFAKKYGFALDALSSSKEDADKSYRQVIDMSKASATDVVLSVPGLTGTLLPYQVAGVWFMNQVMKANRGVLLGDDMGLGKSLQTLCALFLVDAFPVLIGCPKSMKLVWKAEIEKFFGPQDILVIDGKEELEGDDAYRHKIIIVNYEVLQVEENPFPKSQFDRYIPVGHTARLKEIKLRAVVYDEAHLLKNYKSKRGIAAKLLRQRVPYRFALTGTPVLNRTNELLNILSILGQLDAVGGFDVFKARYVDEFGYVGHSEREKRTLELHNQMRASFYLRREKKDVLAELPPVRFTSVPLEIGSRVKYEKALARIKQAGNRRLGLVDLAELRQAAWKAKLDSAVSWVGDLVSQGQNVIVFAEHIEAQNALINDIGKAIGCSVLSIQGQDDGEDRMETQRKFQTGKYPVIVCSLRAAGVGITLTAASHVVFFEYPWTPGEVDQAYARAHRIGQENSVNVWYLVGQGTVDEYWITLLDEKRKTTEAVTSGRAFDDVSSSIVNDLLKYIAKQAGIEITEEA